MTCATCGKPEALCICDAVNPVATRHALLILQHPQEQDRDLGTARLAALQLANSRLAVGLSWPSLAAALGRPADPRRWATLHPWSGAGGGTGGGTGGRLSVAGVDDPRHAAEILASLEGVIVLDGSWSQAKALWWRNPWLLKTRRLALDPPGPSLYGALRREPRASALSTIEAAAFCLAALDGNATILDRALHPFRALLERYRAVAGSTAPDRPVPRPDRRGGRGPGRRKLVRRSRLG
jgi:DTW domain-containing protein YfiP